MTPAYIEFDFDDPSRLTQLQCVFEALKKAKESEDFKDERFWLNFFDERAKSYFWWPSDAEIEDWQRRWFATPLPQRWTEPSLKTGWISMSMIEAFSNGEYELLDCRSLRGNCGRIEFEPLAFPYGGTGCMKALVESFGFRVTGEEGD